MDEKGFFKAVKDGDVAKARAMLDEDPKLAHIRDSEGSTPLHLAAWRGHPAIVEDLLDHGADIDAHTGNLHWGTTAMHAAAHGNRPHVIEVLLRRGADVNSLRASGSGTPLAETRAHNAIAAARVLKAAGGTD